VKLRGRLGRTREVGGGRFILVGPLADQFGAADVLYAAAVWTVISSVAILAIPSVRNLRGRDAPRETSGVDPLTATQAAG
jgi:hypothetical protein